jgi:hypothetical protein
LLGGKELKKLAAQKEILVAESEMNRLALQTGVQNLASAVERLRSFRLSKLRSLLLTAGPLLSLLLRKTAHSRSASWLGRLIAAAKWIGPLYGLWRGYMAGRRRGEVLEPAA